MGPVGIAIDESDYGQFLFVTFEGNNKIELVNAKTMQHVDAVTVSGAENLAGIVVDKNKRKIYIIDRYASHKGYLYVYSWDAQNKTLTLDIPYPYYIQLKDCSRGYGLALDEENGRLYVGDNTNLIKYYNTTNWSKEDEIPVSCNVIGIAIDVVRQLLYYGSMGSYGQGDPNLYQYNLLTGSEQPVYVGSSVAGIAVDEDTGYVYITTYGDGGSGTRDRLMIYNFSLVKQTWESGDIGNPAGVCVPSGNVSYKPPRFYLEKVDVNEPNSVLPGDYITYRITYGPNGYADTNVVITDYLPYEVDYENPLDPNYNSSKHTYTWQIGSLAANDPNKSVTLTVKVNQGAAPDCNISNYCEIESDANCTPITAYTNVGSWQPNSQIIYVDSLSPCAPGTGMSWRFAYRNLQDAFARARDSNEIWVAKGTYKPTSDIYDTDATFNLVSGVPIYGGFLSGGGQRNWMTNETILDGKISESAYVFYVVTADSINDAIVDGFTIRGSSYAGVYLDDANVAIVNCKLKENGSGIDITDNSYPYIHNCLFIKNGISCDSSEPVITNSTFDGNDITSHAIYAASSNVKLAGCTVKNYIYHGIYGYDSTLDLTNSVVCLNGIYGIYLQNMSSPATIKNNWIHNNNTGGIRIFESWPEAQIQNNTVVKNAGYGINCSSSTAPDISNCIVWDNTAGQLNGCSASYSCIQNGGTSNHNIETDPCFFDADANNFHLKTGSLCIDKGSNSAVPSWLLTDIDGEKRIVDGDNNGSWIVDMGADEYYWSPADFNRDEFVNFIDYAIFANAWLTPNSGKSLDGDSNVDIYDLKLFCEDWLWQAGWAKSFTCGAGEGMSQAMGEDMSQTMTDALALQETAEEVSYLYVLAEQQEESQGDNQQSMLAGEGETAGIWLVYDGNMTPNSGDEITVYIHSDPMLLGIGMIVEIAGDANITTAMSEADCNNYGWDNGWNSNPYIDPNGWLYISGVSWECVVNGTVGYFKFRYNSGEVTVSIAEDGEAYDNYFQPVLFSPQPLIFGRDPNEQ